LLVIPGVAPPGVLPLAETGWLLVRSAVGMVVVCLRWRRRWLSGQVRLDA
jgi:hypothetical protein